MISVSARKSQKMDILAFIKRVYPYELKDIDSVFGFTEFCVLYGGRPYNGEELTKGDIETLYDHNIGYRIPLTNHTFTDEEFKESRPFLEKYHRLGNTIITTNDKLAIRIACDYPLYKLEASAIKKLDKIKKVNSALEIYDSVVLPASSNDDVALLNSIKEKDRIRLFIRAGCAYNCDARICYKSVSEMMRDDAIEFACSQDIIKRERLGKTTFDIKAFQELGYSKFKAVP